MIKLLGHSFASEILFVADLDQQDEIRGVLSTVGLGFGKPKNY